MKIKTVLLMLFILLLSANIRLACAASPDATGCVHLVTATGERYSLVYFGEKCAHAGYDPLARQHYKPVLIWASNMSHHGLISCLDKFMILARFATMERGIYLRRDSIFPVLIHEWVHLANRAYLTMQDCLGKDDTRLVEYLEKPLMEKKLIKPDDFFKWKFVPGWLSGTDRMEIAAIFRQFETRHWSDPQLTTISKTIDEAVNEVSAEKYRQASRQHFNEYRIVR